MYLMEKGTQVILHICDLSECSVTPTEQLFKVKFPFTII